MSEPNLTSVQEAYYQGQAEALSRTPCAQLPVDNNHALRIGWVAGALMRTAELEPLTGVCTRGAEILRDDDGNYLDTIRLHARSGTFLVSVTRESYRDEEAS